MKETLLRKEFNKSDVKRIRNIIRKDFTSKTKIQVGSEGTDNTHTIHKEGDVWEEGGKQWVITNGVKRNVTKLDLARKLTIIPISCPKCKKPLRHHLAKKMYKIHGFCFDCTVEYEATLQKAGLYESYEKQMMQGNIKNFIKELEAWTEDELKNTVSVVTEDGVVEDWGSTTENHEERIRKNVREYVDILKKHLE